MELKNKKRWWSFNWTKNRVAPPSLPDCTDTAMRGSVASTDQAASADNLAAKQAAESIAESVLSVVVPRRLLL